MGARLGQHFLNAPWAAQALTDAVAVQKGEMILEIGPGKGALTKVLIATGAPVIAIEKDELLVAQLHETFRADIATKQLTIIPGDVRTFDTQTVQGDYVLAANIPYYITGDIIRRFLTTPHQPRALALLIQKEVAQRIVTRDGKESLLSLSVKAYGTPTIVAKVGKGCFVPPPKVDSAILLIENVSRDFFTDITEEKIFAVLHAGFAAKRKQLGANLKKVYGERAFSALANAGISPTARAEDISIVHWKRVASALS